MVRALSTARPVRARCRRHSRPEITPHAGGGGTARTPPRRATYRLQLTPDFGFDAVAAQLPYLARLGVSHLYLSPITESVPGSMHGYDVADPTRLRGELGGEQGFARLTAAARAHGLALLVDVVPNHMSTDATVNPWWRDVLEDGQQSPFAGWFDIDWSSPDDDLHGRVMVPVLSASLDEALETGEITLVLCGERGLAARAGATELPLSVATVASLLGAAAVRSGSERLAELGTEAMLLPDATGPQERHARRAARDSLRADLDALMRTEPGVAPAIDEMLAALARDHRRLRSLLDAQIWLLDGWRRGVSRLNYRRFFTISSLVGMRAEVEAARALGLRRALELVSSGAVDGLRIDHIDGLRDPGGYLSWLRTRAPGAWIVVEKILASDEPLPQRWECDGTTGYEFAALLSSMSLDAHGVSVLEVLRDDLAGPRPERDELVRAAKLELLDGELAAEWHRVTRALEGVVPDDERLREFPGTLPQEALRELVVALRVYRTYVGDDGVASDADRAALRSASAHAAMASSGVPPRLLDLLAAKLGGEDWDGQGRCALLVARVQQLSPALMAKGLEDTALYRDASAPPRNEVGSDAERPPTGPQAFHAACSQLQATRPLSLLATSTHDTKRGEDVRARLCALSELAIGWAPTVRGWVDRHHHLDPGGDAMLVLIQVLLGAWPIGAERAHDYLVKAMREASERTSWTDPDAGYEGRLRNLVDGLLEDSAFVAEVGAVVARLAPLGERISLAWTLLRLTAPGIPDTYQGCELWDLSLVDPDNRRPVDFERRAALLETALAATPAELLAASAPGLPKLAVIARALDLRRRRPDLFGAGGDYHPLSVTGELADHAVAFARGAVPGAVTVVPRLPARAGAGWRGTVAVLPEGSWRDLITGGVHSGGEVTLDALLSTFPVALLEGVEN